MKWEEMLVEVPVLFDDIENDDRDAVHCTYCGIRDETTTPITAAKSCGSSDIGAESHLRKAELAVNGPFAVQTTS